MSEWDDKARDIRTGEEWRDSKGEDAVERYSRQLHEREQKEGTWLAADFYIKLSSLGVKVGYRQFQIGGSSPLGQLDCGSSKTQSSRVGSISIHD